MNPKQVKVGSKITELVKKEVVLTVALLLAVGSALVVPPDEKYLEYIDFRTLAVLLCLMAVMEGLQRLGVFQRVAGLLLAKVNSCRSVLLVLVLLCFFFSMLITNDVALITFVPFTFVVLGMLGEEAVKLYTVPVVVLQTVAANLGSMLTPIGNPQNLYLYGRAEMGLGSFIWLMLPYTLASLILVTIWCCLLKGPKESRELVLNGEKQKLSYKFYIYLILFAICLLTVAHILPYGIMLALVVVIVLLTDARTLLRVDYGLLFTFIGFFIFIGNMGRIPAFSEFVQKIIEGNEVYTAIIASQFISNVPAALLLSGFTGDYRDLIVGTNLGGLGTLIASMASLISYKYIAGEKNISKGKYFLYFTVVNICFLVLLVLLYKVLE